MVTRSTPAGGLSEGAVALRPWRLDDAPALVRRINDASIAAFLDLIPQPYEHSDAVAYLTGCEEGWRTGATSNFAVFVDGMDGPAGSVGIRWSEIDDGVAEIGYWVAAEVRGRGVATTATRLATRWAFAAEPRLERLQLRADVENEPSNRVAAKAGFTREGVLRSARHNARLDRRVDFAIWSLLRDEVR
jgi:RimJ/RimL family protein N-acetyltransferase